MKKVLLSLMATLIVIVTFAQVQEATVTVQSIGSTEEEATHQALRSAIEQTFGTFVSANTTILNDELVRDDIISISNGNIKHYDKLSVISMPDGNIVVTVKATVSVNKLISYAKSKGSRAEFEGQSYAANVKYMKLRAKNAEELLRSTADQIDILAKDMFDFSLNLGEPRKEDDEWTFPSSVILCSNITTHNVVELLKKVLNALSITEEEYSAFNNAGISAYHASTPVPQFSHYERSTLITGNYDLYIPISNDVMKQFINRIARSIVSSIFGFKIVEIGDTQNSFYFKKTPNNHYDGFWDFFSEKRNSIIPSKYGEPLIFNDTWAEHTYVFISHHITPVSPKGGSIEDAYEDIKKRHHGSFGHPISPLCIDGNYYVVLFWSPCSIGTDILFESLKKYELDVEEYIPIKLTMRQRMLQRIGEYDGPTHTIKYQGGKPIYAIPVTLSIPEDKMETFQGFEIMRDYKDIFKR